METLFKGFVNFGWQQAVMIAVGLVLIVLAIKKEYEPVITSYSIHYTKLYE